jgi:hypothetical protein
VQNKLALYDFYSLSLPTVFTPIFSIIYGIYLL